MFYLYVLLLKDQIESQGVASVGFQELVHVLWSLTVTEDESIPNPLIPKLWERLHQFNRPGKPMSREELLELYQVNAYA